MIFFLMLPREFKRLFATLVFALVFVGCKREDLYYATDSEANIVLNVSWDDTGLTPNGLTVWVYLSDSTLYRALPTFSSTETISFSLPEGEYDILLFNDSPSEHEALEFIDVNHIDSVSVMSVKDFSSQDETLVVEPNVLAVSVVRGVEVTSQMVDYYPNKTIPEELVTTLEYNVTLVRVVSNYFVTVYVTDIHYASSAPLVTFEHLSDGYMLGQKIATEGLAQHQFYLEERVFDDGSTTNASISSEFTNFGVFDSEDATYIMDLDFELINGDHYIESFDVTDYVRGTQLTRSGSIVDAEISLELGLPTVIGGTDNAEGVFDTEVGAWETVEQELAM